MSSKKTEHLGNDRKRETTTYDNGSKKIVEKKEKPFHDKLISVEHCGPPKK